MVKQGEKEIMGGKLSKQTGRLQMRERFERGPMKVGNLDRKVGVSQGSCLPSLLFCAKFGYV